MKIIVTLFPVLLACLCFYLLKEKNNISKKAIWSLYFILFAIAIYFFIPKIIYRISNPEIWDFTCFYLWGKVAAQGHNFYLPENSQLVFNSLHLPFSNFDGFIDEIINVGFFYPPPTMLYFVPLGFLSYHTALVSWTIFNLIFLAGCIYLVYKLFLEEFKVNGLLFAIILFFIFSPVKSTILYSQTNFILLFLLLLMKKYGDSKYAGIILAIAIFTKPYMAIFVLYFLLKKNWKAIIYFIVSTAVILGLTVAVFGTDCFSSYIFNNSANRIPAWVFSEDVNQSLHGVLLRAKIIFIGKSFIYPVIATGILLLTIVLLYFLQQRKLYDYIWAILLLIALLIYPATLSHYAVMLLFIVFQLVDEKKQLGFNLYWSIPIICIFFILVSFSVFASICFLLVVLILKSIKLLTSNKIIIQEDY